MKTQTLSQSSAAPAASHTPGPWDVTPIRSDRGLIRIEGGPDRLAHVPGYQGGGRSAVCWVETCFDGQSVANPAKQNANARLIGAAPDLLERLKESTGWLDAMRGEICAELENTFTAGLRAELTERLGFLDAHRENVRGTIAKAEGTA